MTTWLNQIHQVEGLQEIRAALLGRLTPANAQDQDRRAEFMTTIMNQIPAVIANGHQEGRNQIMQQLLHMKHQLEAEFEKMNMILSNCSLTPADHLRVNSCKETAGLQMEQLKVECLNDLWPCLVNPHSLGFLKAV